MASNDNHQRLVGFYALKVAPELGRVTKLENRGGKVVATTASGVEMIVPSEPVGKDGSRAFNGPLLFSRIGDPEKW